MKTIYKIKKFKEKFLWYSQMIKLAFENKYEVVDNSDGDYSTRSFLILFLIALLKNKTCWQCKGRGRTGYYEPEDCGTCDGFGINWKNEPEPNWEEMAKGMDEYFKEMEKKIEQ